MNGRVGAAGPTRCDLVVDNSVFRGDMSLIKDVWKTSPRRRLRSRQIFWRRIPGGQNVPTTRPQGISLTLINLLALSHLQWDNLSPDSIVPVDVKRGLINNLSGLLGLETRVQLEGA
jgi:hypothetical protein